jgi:hypothetical protein
MHQRQGNGQTDSGNLYHDFLAQGTVNVLEINYKAP